MSAEVAARLAELRAGLLSGRGPGASQIEVERHTRWRTDLGGRRTASVREDVAEQAARARAEPAALARANAEVAARLAETIVVLCRRLGRHGIVG